ncbi:uncharacterized protein EV154DRAFT_515197 [Mucor mucedo]|uniref:uncharacterized protein n=1 Tax=Mucor mucedo TaxID=29922 RepID=UPI00221F6A3C|nr:uncharacterized protein EV154DRAFT_515197 [Mucor mucedo]KAI7889318.1 hypothetical protein EV154DRAFT_515197 [Mucor mucedo]
MIVRQINFFFYCLLPSLLVIFIKVRIPFICCSPPSNLYLLLLLQYTLSPQLKFIFIYTHLPFLMSNNKKKGHPLSSVQIIPSVHEYYRKHRFR